jgi:hypothetical protein
MELFITQNKTHVTFKLALSHFMTNSLYFWMKFNQMDYMTKKCSDFAKVQFQLFQNASEEIFDRSPPKIQTVQK